MTDVMLVWDSPLLFEKLFTECGLECMRVDDTALCTPFLPPSKCLILPTGFANPAYSKVCKGIGNKGKKLADFVKKGGTLIIFGPLVSSYSFEWLPFKLEYIEEHEPFFLHQINHGDTPCIVENLSERVECDGYFSKAEATVILENERKQPVMIEKKIGKGKIMASTIHEFPSKKFITYMVEMGTPATI
jgi:hypothetical protein